ncbi:MAG: sigma-54-dependent Fis family transcriptional regulator [Gemmatimonadota bacterium]|nr:MAG: sigma-54-dependent Fis family transcriptional regulator [Gemmatimonadota bacterium]
MSEDSTRACLTVVQFTDSFEQLWPEIAQRVGATLERLSAPEPVRDLGSTAVLLACAGDEGHAVDYLHLAHRSGIGDAIVVGAEPDHRLAVELMRRGASAYYALPGDAERLEREISARVRRTANAGRRRRGTERAAYDFSTIVGEDASLRAALDRAARVIPGGRATVLITGETGTGKELFARAIHHTGPRADQPFVAVNCSAIPSTLLESELFGHERGAFTDARAAKPGLFEVADRGTVFLDEVGTLHLELQGKLLRFLESREVRRLGGARDKRVDVQIVAATNAELREEIAAGAFREDLYYRLAVIPIALPPLRDRGEDVVLLARRFLAELASEYGVGVPTLSTEALAALRAHPWPGNVRELRNAIERALLLCSGDRIGSEELALDETPGVASAPAVASASFPPHLPFPASLAALEAEAARQMLIHCAGNKSEAARRLGITRSRLYRILERSGEGVLE